MANDNFDLFPHLAYLRPQRDARTLVRSTDPDTSRIAAQSIVGKITALQMAVLDYAAWQGPVGFTDWEMQEHFNNHGSTYRTRRSELLHRKFLRDTGQVRKKAGSNRLFTVWEITQAGMARAEHPVEWRSL